MCELIVRSHEFLLSLDSCRNENSYWNLCSCSYSDLLADVAETVVVAGIAAAVVVVGIVVVAAAAVDTDTAAVDTLVVAAGIAVVAAVVADIVAVVADIVVADNAVDEVRLLDSDAGDDDDDDEFPVSSG